MSVANITVHRNPAEARQQHLGLSNGLFCNKSRFIAKVSPTQILVRQAPKAKAEPAAGLSKAREAIASTGYKGEMSNRTRSNVVGMLAEWFTAARASTGKAYTTANASARRFTFCTLTLCAKQMHTDNYLKRNALGRFLQECKRKYNAGTHFWRAEDQRNGNIHFHILFAVEIPWQQVRSTWNAILKDLGYLQLYTTKMQEANKDGFKPSQNPNDKRPISKQIEAYKAGVKCGWTNPNSTDIHALSKVKNAAAYVCKYVSKDKGARKIEGRIWGCTDDLRQLSTPEVGITQEFMRGLRLAAYQGDIELVQLEHVAIYKGDIASLLAYAAPELLAGLNAYYVDISAWLLKLHSGATPHQLKPCYK